MYRMSFFFSLPSWVQMIFYALYTAKPSKELQYNLFVNNQLVKKSTCTFVCTSYAFVQGLLIITLGYCTGRTVGISRKKWILHLDQETFGPTSIPGNHWCDCWGVWKRWQRAGRGWEEISIHTLAAFTGVCAHSELCAWPGSGYRKEI